MRKMNLTVVTGMLGMLLLGGCSMQDAMCGSGEYPVKVVNSTSGGACVKNGEEPPSEYVRYPEGKVPQRVGDEWDTYWDTHMLDESGKEIPA